MLLSLWDMLHAQEAPVVAPAQTLQPVDALPPAQATPALVLPFADRWIWRHLPATSNTARVLTGLSVHPQTPGLWLAGDASGTIFRSEDGGQTWEEALAPISLGEQPDEPDEEDVLLSAESYQEEEVDPSDLAGSVEVASETATALTEQREQALRQLRAATVGTTPWFVPGRPEIALAGRSDGLWRSRDGGIVWQKVEDAAATSFFVASDGMIVAGTVDGLRFSTDDGRSWMDVTDPTDDTTIFHITEAWGALYAAGEAGLYRSVDGLHWEQLPVDGPVFDVVADPDWSGGFWVATAVGLLRSDDNGASFAAFGRLPPMQVVGLRHMGAPGHLLCWGSDGVWESTDGGLRWRAAVRLLTTPDVRALAMDAGHPLIATADGLWRMEEPEAMPARFRQREAVMPLYTTLDLAQDRAGLELSPIMVTKWRYATVLVPTLQLTGELQHDEITYSDLEAGQFISASGEANQFAVTARLCWGGCGSVVETSSGYYDTSTGEYVETLDVEDTTDPSSDLFVVDGEIYAEGQVAAAAANIAERTTRYRQEVASRAAEAWLTRKRLVDERAQMAAFSLQAQIEHELRIQEQSARLDIWTDGAFTKSIQVYEEMQ